MIPSTGWTLLVKRLRTESRDEATFSRTVGTYQVFHDGVAVPALSGMTVEREGPGDNGEIGVEEHRCIESGTYPAGMHDTETYSTTSFERNGDHPRPAVALRNTVGRTAILIHPAAGFGSTIGCINLGHDLVDGDSDLSLADGTRRVIALIDDLRSFTHGLPDAGGIARCGVMVEDPPNDQVGTKLVRRGCRGPFVKAWQVFLAGQGFDPSTATGEFGAATAEATRRFQSAQELGVDGKVGRRTLATARSLGFGAPTAPGVAAPGARRSRVAAAAPSGVLDAMAGAAAGTAQAGAFGFASEWKHLLRDLMHTAPPSKPDSELARRARDRLTAKFPGRTLMMGFDIGIFTPANADEDEAEKAEERAAFETLIGDLRGAGSLASIYLEGAFGATGDAWERHEAERFMAAAIDAGLTTAQKAPKLVDAGNGDVELTQKLAALVKTWDKGGHFWKHTIAELKDFGGKGFAAAEIDNLDRPFNEVGATAFDRPGLPGILGFYRTFADEFANGRFPKLILKNLNPDALAAVRSKLTLVDAPDKLPRAMFADFHIFETPDDITDDEKDALEADIAMASAALGIQAVFSRLTAKYRTHGQFGDDARRSLEALSAAPMGVATSTHAGLAGAAEVLPVLAAATRRLEASAKQLAGLIAARPDGRAAASAGIAGAAAAASIGLTAAQRLICERIINVFETGSIRGDYANISIFHDGPHRIRQVTYGRAQTTEYGNLRELVQMYVAAGGQFASDLRPFVDLIGNTALVDDDDFKGLLKRAGREDPVMVTTQDAFFEKRYFQPAQDWAVTNGFTRALSMLVIYDSQVHSGGILRILRSRFPEVPPARGGDEREWIRQYVDVRQDWLATHDNEELHATVYRTRAFKREIERGNWDLSQVPIMANGVAVSADTGPAGMSAVAGARGDDIPYLGPPARKPHKGRAPRKPSTDAGEIWGDDHHAVATAAAAAAATTAQLAARILASANISLATSHVSGRGVGDGADPRQNITDTAAGQRARRSRYENAPGGTVALDRRLLSGMLSLAEAHAYSVNELCGGSHSPNSRHYAGIALDVGSIDGRTVSEDHPGVEAFMDLCRDLGATEVLGPGDAHHDSHVHAAWPRP